MSQKKEEYKWNTKHLENRIKGFPHGIWRDSDSED